MRHLWPPPPPQLPPLLPLPLPLCELQVLPRPLLAEKEVAMLVQLTTVVTMVSKTA
jgi:hypothetical protein